MDLFASAIKESKTVSARVALLRSSCPNADRLLALLTEMTQIFEDIDLGLYGNLIAMDATMHDMTEASLTLTGIFDVLNAIKAKLTKVETRKDSFFGVIYNNVRAFQYDQRLREFHAELSRQLAHTKNNFVPVLDDIIKAKTTANNQIKMSIQELSVANMQDIRNILENHLKADKRVLWLSGLPAVWDDFPDLKIGQIKYIYFASSKVFADHFSHIDHPYGELELKDSHDVQFFMESRSEIPTLTANDYQFVLAQCQKTPELTIEQLIPLMNERFKSTNRRFSLLLVSFFSLFFSSMFLILCFSCWVVKCFGQSLKLQLMFMNLVSVILLQRFLKVMLKVLGRQSMEFARRSKHKQLERNQPIKNIFLQSF